MTEGFEPGDEVLYTRSTGELVPAVVKGPSPYGHGYFVIRYQRNNKWVKHDKAHYSQIAPRGEPPPQPHKHGDPPPRSQSTSHHRSRGEPPMKQREAEPQRRLRPLPSGTVIPVGILKRSSSYHNPREKAEPDKRPFLANAARHASSPNLRAAQEAQPLRRSTSAGNMRRIASDQAMRALKAIQDRESGHSKPAKPPPSRLELQEGAPRAARAQQHHLGHRRESGESERSRSASPAANGIRKMSTDSEGHQGSPPRGKHLPTPIVQVEADLIPPGLVTVCKDPGPPGGLRPPKDEAAARPRSPTPGLRRHQSSPNLSRPMSPPKPKRPSPSDGLRPPAPDNVMRSPGKNGSLSPKLMPDRRAQLSPNPMRASPSRRRSKSPNAQEQQQLLRAQSSPNILQSAAGRQKSPKSPTSPVVTESVASMKERFNFLKIIGHGSSGKVHMVTKNADSHVYALKMAKCPNRRSPSYVLNEVEFMKEHRHPHIVRYHEFFFHDDGSNIYVCLLMDMYLEKDLQQWLQKHNTPAKPVTPQKVMDFSLQACDAINWLHVHDMVHRDVKPANFLLSHQATRLTLTDLALLRQLENDGEELLSTVVGTPAYMAPEQARGCYSCPVDMWALGVLLLDFLLPQRKEQVMYMELVMMGEIVFHDTLKKQLENLRLWPKSLIDLCLSLLQLEPSCRPEASEVLSQLRGWIRGKAPEPLPGRRSSVEDCLKVPDHLTGASGRSSGRRGSQDDSKSPGRRLSVDPTSAHLTVSGWSSREGSKSPLHHQSGPVGLPPRSDAARQQLPPGLPVDRSPGRRVIHPTAEDPPNGDQVDRQLPAAQNEGGALMHEARHRPPVLDAGVVRHNRLHQVASGSSSPTNSPHCRSRGSTGQFNRSGSANNSFNSLPPNELHRRVSSSLLQRSSSTSSPVSSLRGADSLQNSFDLDAGSPSCLPSPGVDGHPGHHASKVVVDPLYPVVRPVSGQPVRR
mmetsp:Transcript_33362/g.59758  ORF Transcript_33362/g.59758 Transcript_33362/m.59758 type:complete len:970 (-) Transcript_33362:2840-5749(-)